MAIYHFSTKVFDIWKISIEIILIYIKIDGNWFEIYNIFVARLSLLTLFHSMFFDF